MALRARDYNRNEEEKYTYGDYAKWPDEERWELIDGVPYAMTAPSRIHQKVLKKLAVQIEIFLTQNESNCEMYFAPFDVRLPKENEIDDKAISTVTQPDILVACDSDKLDHKGMKGAPDFIIEILSPSTAGKDQITKLYLYEKHGVKEYWIVHPVDQIVTVYLLNENGEYERGKYYDKTGSVESRTLPGLAVNLGDVFDENIEN